LLNREGRPSNYKNLSYLLCTRFDLGSKVRLAVFCYSITVLRTETLVNVFFRTRCLVFARLRLVQGVQFVYINLRIASVITFDPQWVAQLMRQAKTRYPRNLAPNAQGTPLMGEYHKAIRERHAGVLGLAAFVHAHPHTTPDYLPQVITELAGHVHDPQPIGKTVSDTLAAYSRNHQDNWHEQRHKFTEEQLEEYLSVVSAAVYYV
uniref:DUF3437 domain-containing protein n=1 Tax=Echinostoma caproni TaxID=27848 RepID=A0A183B923_9TREM